VGLVRVAIIGGGFAGLVLVLFSVGAAAAAAVFGV
jgi:hypothetical protein